MLYKKGKLTWKQDDVDCPWVLTSFNRKDDAYYIQDYPPGRARREGDTRLKMTLQEMQQHFKMESSGINSLTTPYPKRGDKHV